MLDLQDITIEYLQQKFQPELLIVVLDACTVLQRFNLTQYEFDLINLITQAQEIEDNDIRSIFIQRVMQELEKLLKDHFITLDDDANPTLKELTELGMFLMLLQDLENPEQAAYRANGHGSPKAILIDLITLYSTIPRFRAMEIISDVDDMLITAICAMLDDKLEQVDSDEHQRAQWQMFRTFIEETDCLGLRLYQQGYFGLTLQELMELSRFSLQDYLHQSALERISKTALDTLSLMYICRDTYESPLLGFDKNAANLFTDHEHITRVRGAVSAIINDYAIWFKVYGQAKTLGKEIVNGD